MSTAFDILGVISPSMAAVAKPTEADVSVPRMLAPGLACGLAGFALWEKHPMLGFLSGEVVGTNLYRFYRGEGTDRNRTITNLAVVATATASSLMMPRHPFWGYVAGFVAGAAVTAFVPGSNASKLLRRSK